MTAASTGQLPHSSVTQPTSQLCTQPSHNRTEEASQSPASTVADNAPESSDHDSLVASAEADESLRAMMLKALSSFDQPKVSTAQPCKSPVTVERECKETESTLSTADKGVVVADADEPPMTSSEAAGSVDVEVTPAMESEQVESESDGQTEAGSTMDACNNVPTTSAVRSPGEQAGVSSESNVAHISEDNSMVTDITEDNMPAPSVPPVSTAQLEHSVDDEPESTCVQSVTQPEPESNQAGIECVRQPETKSNEGIQPGTQPEPELQHKSPDTSNDMNASDLAVVDEIDESDDITVTSAGQNVEKDFGADTGTSATAIPNSQPTTAADIGIELDEESTSQRESTQSDALERDAFVITSPSPPPAGTTGWSTVVNMYFLS